ncbi:serine/threonine-protein kinase DCLK3-like, partial [Coregonus clupeaformis]|uniref:serine/threonine-protein kinase DCLK3-like n=1 Tax=Coregonus clupeaformis TaxID=59861 RepID=UPI001E1C93A1
MLSKVQSDHDWLLWSDRAVTAPLRKVTVLLNRRGVVSYEQLLLDVSEALGFPRWHRARVTHLYTPHAREVRGVCDFFRGEAAFLALGKSRPELRSVKEALEEMFPQHSRYCDDALRYDLHLIKLPRPTADTAKGRTHGQTAIHSHRDATWTDTHIAKHSTHNNTTRQSIHPTHTLLDTDAHIHTHPNTHSNRNSTHPSHPPNQLQRVRVKRGTRERLSSPIGPLTQEEEQGEIDTLPPPRSRNCKLSEQPNQRAGRAPLPPVTRKQIGNRPNDQEVEKPHVGPARRHTGPICRIEEESLSQSERSSSDSKQEEAGTKQKGIFDLPSDNSDVTLSDIERCYDISRTVGDGNFAVVRECRRRDNGEAFAVKIVERSKLIGREHMMQNELSILGSLSHPRVVRLFIHHHTHTHSYLVMEMVTGGDLFEAIAERGKFPEEEAGLMVCDVSEALRYIHSKTIVHRDLKPENLLVEHSSDGVRRLKLGDFGLAMVVTEPIFTVCGTPTYVAPEILSETGYGLPVDLWALGVIVYILLCGFPPFRRRDRDQEEMFQLIIEAHLTFLSPYWITYLTVRHTHIYRH